MNWFIRKLLARCMRSKQRDPCAVDDKVRRLAVRSSRGAQLAGIIGDLRRQPAKTTTGNRNGQEPTHG